MCSGVETRIRLTKRFLSDDISATSPGDVQPRWNGGRPHPHPDRSRADREMPTATRDIAPLWSTTLAHHNPTCDTVVNHRSQP
jgi:hypothetical protein